jgi:transcriptional regulator with XRE-family HTH domain
MTTSDNFAANIKKARQDLGLDDHKAALLLDLTVARVLAYESAEEEPSIEILRRIATRYQVTSDSLLGLPEKKGILEEILVALTKDQPRSI